MEKGDKLVDMSSNMLLKNKKSSTILDFFIFIITRRVNGGTNGLAHRLSEFKKFWELIK
jgi:hypothetical protein